MFTYCFNDEFTRIFISLLRILYFYDDERCKMNFPDRDNTVLFYCIVLTIVSIRAKNCIPIGLNSKQQIQLR